MVEQPWANIAGCTTPSWIADNVPAVTVGGGLWSRIVTVWAEAKAHLVYDPRAMMSADEQAYLTEMKHYLISDLEHISITLCGEYTKTPAADAWEKAWYADLWATAPPADDEQRAAYTARKQTHLNKLAMVIAAAQRDELTITEDDYGLANVMLTDMEADMAKVFAKIGRSEASLQTEKLLTILRRHKVLRYDIAYQIVHNHFPDFHDFEGILAGLIRAGYLDQVSNGEHFYLKVKETSPITQP